MMNVLSYKNLVMAGVTGLLLLNSGCTAGGTSASSLNARFSTAGSVNFVQDPSNSSFAYDPNAVGSQASALSVSLALSIAPPSTANTGGVQLYASDIKVVGNKVITGYNVPGAVDRGWLDYVDVTTIALPILQSSIYLSDTDVNSIAMNNGNFFVVGAKENIGATMRSGTYGLLGATLGSSDTYLSSFAGTGATYNTTGTQIAVTTGNTGDVTVMNATTLANAGTPASLADARGITYSSVNNKYYAVNGTNATISSYDTTGQLITSTSLGAGATIAASKATVVAGSTGEFLLVTKGDGGFSVVCASDMKVAATQAAYQYANYASLGLADPTQTVTNAATFGPGLIFTASGDAGIRVYNFQKAAGASSTNCQNISVSYLGFFAFNTPVSANNLYYQNILSLGLSYTGTLYVATGAGGFKAVTVTATKNTLNDILEF